MKLQKLILHNFRAYSHETIDFGDGLTCIIGKNDTGKSTILTALEWFFSDKQSKEYDLNVNSSVYDGLLYVEAIFSDISFPKYDFKFYFDDERVQQDEFTFFSDLVFIQSLEISLRKYSNVEREITISCGKKNVNVNPFTFGGTTIKRMCQSLYDAYNHNSNNCFIRTTHRISKDDWWEWDNDNGNFYWSEFNYFKPNSSLEYYLNILFKQRFYEKSLEKQILSIKTSLSNDIGNELIGIAPKKGMSFNSLINKINFFPNGSDLFFEMSDSLLSQIPLTNRGDGFQLQIKNSVCKLLANDMQNGNKRNFIFAFEELETHLHPKAQLEMYNSIKELSKSNQVIITTHSPYIVKELAKDNIKPIVIKREEQANKSYISSLDERVLPYISMNEINYIAFDLASTEYHQELYGRIEIEWLNESNGNKIGDVINSVINLPNYQFRNDLLCILKDFYTELHPNTTIPSDKELVKLYIKGMNFVSPDKDEKNDVSICYCVRNSIDHPCQKNVHYQGDQWVSISTKILYTLLKTINRIKKDNLSYLIQSLCNSKKA